MMEVNELWSLSFEMLPGDHVCVIVRYMSGARTVLFLKFYKKTKNRMILFIKFITAVLYYIHVPGSTFDM